MSLYEKIFKVMESTKGLDKNMTVGTGNSSYKAISEATVLGEIKPLLKANRLVLIPIKAEMTEVVNTYETSRGTTTRCMTQLTEYWKIVDIDTGESEIVVGVGNGADSQDKGSGKASTYAYKNMLSKLFMLFSGEDTDNTHSDDISKEMTKPIAPIKSRAKTITKDQADNIEYLLIDTDNSKEALLESLHIKELTEMTETQYPLIVARLEAIKKEKKG